MSRWLQARWFVFLRQTGLGYRFYFSRSNGSRLSTMNCIRWMSRASGHTSLSVVPGG